MRGAEGLSQEARLRQARRGANREQGAVWGPGSPRTEWTRPAVRRGGREAAERRGRQECERLKRVASRGASATRRTCATIAWLLEFCTVRAPLARLNFKGHSRMQRKQSFPLIIYYLPFDNLLRCTLHVMLPVPRPRATRAGCCEWFVQYAVPCGQEVKQPNRRSPCNSSSKTGIRA